MSLPIGTWLCLLPIPFAALNSIYHLTARYPVADRGRRLAVNAMTIAFFVALGLTAAGDSSHLVTMARLVLPIVYFWWTYAWVGATLHLYHRPEFSYDLPLLARERRWFGNPSAWLGRRRPRWMNEIMHFSYWAYFAYTPALGIGLYAAGELRQFEAMGVAMCLCYTISYSIYPWFPLWGPRWTLFSEGELPADEQVFKGYLFTGFMNRIMWSDTAHKGGAMPSAHSAIGIAFIVWCGRVWGAQGLLIGGLVGGMMLISTIYGRFHYVIDVIVGVLIGVLSIALADLLLL